MKKFFLILSILLLIAIFMLPAIVYPQVKLSDLPRVYTPNDSSYWLISDEVSGTRISKAITLGDLSSAVLRNIPDYSLISSFSPTNRMFVYQEGTNKSFSYQQLYDAFDDSIKGFLINSFDGNYDLRPGQIYLANLSTALINYINASGGGTITNNPDDVTLENVTEDEIGIKWSWLDGVVDSVRDDAYKSVDTLQAQVVDTFSVRVPKLTSIADLRSLPSNTGYSVAETKGYYSSGDGGAGQWYWNPTSTAADDSAMVIKVTAITTGRWLRIQMGNVYHLEWFGIKADGIQDETWNIQKAVNYAMSGGAGKVICNTEGIFVISNTLKLGYGDVYASLTFSAISNYRDGTGSVIDASALTNRPAINIQGARKTIIEGWTIKGGNDEPVTNYDGQILDKDTTDWVDANLTNGRYNPYCAISIDAYSGTGGAGFYSNDSYSRLNSSVVEIRNCFIWKFVVGIAVQVNNQGYNCEVVNIHDNIFQSNTYHISIGGSQSRGTVISDFIMGGSHTAITTNTHGNQQGNIPEVRGGSINQAYQLFSVNTAFSPMYVQKIHCETFMQIGFLGGTSSSQQPASFEGCTFNIDEATGTYRGMVHLITNSPTLFSGCTFIVPYGILNVVGSSDIKYDHCHFDAGASGWNDVFYLDISYALQQPMRTMVGCNFRTAIVGGSTRHPINNENSFYSLGTGRQHILSNTKTIWAADSCFLVKSGDTEFYGLTSGYSWSDSGLTFTSADSSYCVGDILRWQSISKNGTQYIVPSLKVTSTVNNKTTVTASRLFNEDEYDEAYAPALITVALRHYLHGTVPTGDVASGNDTIKNVTNAGTLFMVGDIVSGTGIPNDNRIREISGTNLIMIKNNTGTQVGAGLYFGRRRGI